MKIGIITIQKCDNFGADLQAYALQKKLQLMGYDAENIDYLFYKNPRHQKRAGEKPIFKLSLVNRLKEKIFPLVVGLRNLRHWGKMAKRRARFEAWFKAHVRCGKEYRSVRSLYEDMPQYDVYMVGSDQVWNPRMGSNILPYFLNFAPPEARKVSYAASLGVGSLTTPVFLKYRELLSEFSHIGLREAQGVELIARMKLGAEVRQVLDPTLLLTADDWAQVASAPAARPSADYLLLYDLIASPETVEMARGLAAKRGLVVVRMGDGAYGPGEFLWLFAHASCVVTNSFHGTVFSILNEKEFVSVIPRGMTNASRIESLLKVVGLETCVVRAEESARGEELPRIDWSEVRTRLEGARRESVDFLERVLSGEKKVPDAKFNTVTDRVHKEMPGFAYRMTQEEALAFV